MTRCRSDHMFCPTGDERGSAAERANPRRDDRARDGSTGARTLSRGERSSCMAATPEFQCHHPPGMPAGSDRSQSGAATPARYHGSASSMPIPGTRTRSPIETRTKRMGQSVSSALSGSSTGFGDSAISHGPQSAVIRSFAIGVTDAFADEPTSSDLTRGFLTGRAHRRIAGIASAFFGPVKVHSCVLKSAIREDLNHYRPSGDRIVPGKSPDSSSTWTWRAKFRDCIARDVMSVTRLIAEFRWPPPPGY